MPNSHTSQFNKLEVRLQDLELMKEAFKEIRELLQLIPQAENKELLQVL
jgi:hypothetical protein